MTSWVSAVTVAAQVGAGLPTKGTPTGQAVAGPCKLPSRIPLTAHWIALQMCVNLRYLLDILVKC
jgi:hypothetical protein